jgi:type I restriction enzyme S subunit
MDYRGRTPKKLGMDWGGGSIPAISARNVRMGHIDFSEEHYLGSDALYKRWMTNGDMKRGDVLITTEAPLGYVAAVPDDNRYILSQRTVLIRPRQDSFDETFFLKMLQSPAFQRLLSENASGSTALGIQRRRLEKLSVSMPPLPEQRRIGQALQDIDDLIATLERLIAKKQVIRQGMLQQLLTGRTRLPGFDGSWPQLTLGDAVEFLDSQRRPVKVGDRAKMRGDIPYYGASGVVDHVNRYLFDEDLILLGEDGENILSRAVPLAFKISGKSWVNNHAHVLRPRPGFNSDFLTAYLESLDYSSLNTGTAQPKLNKQSCLAIRVHRPPVPEQHAIASALSDVDAEISTLQTRLDKVRDIKTGMMQQLLTGRTRLPVAEGAA